MFLLNDIFCFANDVRCQGLCTSEYKVGPMPYQRRFGCGVFTCGDNGGDGDNMFANMTVVVLDQGSVRMEDLQVGDLVLTGSPGHFKDRPIYAFGHQVVDDFYAITKGNRVPLEMIGDHYLIYLAKEQNRLT
jgi:hypothetical protein